MLCIDDILLASGDIGLLYETKQILSKTFEMKDFGEAFFVLCNKFTEIGLMVFWDYLKMPLLIVCLKGLTLKPGDAPIVKGNKFSKSKCPNN